MYADLTTANRSFLKRFSHRRRFDMALQLMDVAAGDCVLDYGAGSGYMLRLLLPLEAREIWLYEPDQTLFGELTDELHSLPKAERVNPIQDVSLAGDESFDKICCLEVLEHLPENRLREALLNIRRLLKFGGHCVVSVPLEVGLSALVKNLARFALGQAHGGAGMLAIVRATLGTPGRRNVGTDFIDSHIGFDHRVLPAYFAECGLSVLSKRYTPFRMLGPVLNSQVFFVLKKSA